MEYLRPSLSHGLVSFICEKLLNSHILLIFDMDGTLRIRASDKKNSSLGAGLNSLKPISEKSSRPGIGIRFE